MKFFKICLIIAVAALAGLPLAARAGQIAPNPNPETGTITVADGASDYNATGVHFLNYGSIYVDGLLTNNGWLDNAASESLGYGFIEVRGDDIQGMQPI